MAIDARTGRVLDPRPLACELGDFAQYVWVLGDLAGDPDLQAHALSWGRTVASAVDEGGLLDADRLRMSGPRFCSSLAGCDALWGLTELTRLTGDAALEAATARWFDGLCRYAMADGLLVYGVATMGSVHLRLPMTTPMLPGYVAESMVEFSRRTGQERFLERAEQILRAALGSGAPPSRLRTGTSGIARLLLPLVDGVFTLRGRPASRYAELVKGDVYLLFAVLGYARATNDSWARQIVSTWIAWILATMRAEDGRFWNQVDPRSARRMDLSLGHNHSVIELLLDVAYDLGDAHALEAAATTAGAWLATRGATGLIPNEDGSPDALLDPQVDLAVNLLKLWRLTGEDAWRQAFEELADAVHQRFRLPHGLAWRVDASSGEVLGTRIESKFLGLFLKLPLLQELVLVQGRHPLEDHAVRCLATDR